MNKTYFEILRAGINSTLQDLGRNHQHHIGIPLSGAMDRRNYLICNKLVSNNLNEALLEFAYQGPLLKLKNGKALCAVTGNVIFKIIRRNNVVEEGKCYQTFELDGDDQIDIISTNKSVYGYFSVNGGFKGDNFWGSCSVNTRAKIGSNNGEKFASNQKIILNQNKSNFKNKQLKHLNYKIEFIRVIQGTNYDFFSEESKKKFVDDDFIISKLTDRMGMRLEGPKIENIVKTNIKSEGLIKGVIQVPPDGKPIIMLSDHGTIGGYPKIGAVISADYEKVVQLTPGSVIKFKFIDLLQAENLYKIYNLETQSILNQIK